MGGDSTRERGGKERAGGGQLEEEKIASRHTRHSSSMQQPGYGPRRKCRRARPQEPPLFLPTHLALLRALHADDGTAAGANLADSCCPRPSWVEVNNFLLLQGSIRNREAKARRTKQVLASLAGIPPTDNNTTGTTTTSPLSHEAVPPTSTGQQQRQRGTGIDKPRRLDPRSVVTAVLRRAVRERGEEHVSASAGLRRLRRGVDDTVDHLSSSLDVLTRSRRDRATPWRSQWEEEQGSHVADVVERHVNKLRLWRRLQGALSALNVGSDQTGQAGNRASRQEDANQC
ncbi:unnamed protein product [Ectocarpus fasciculatus]